MSYALRYWGEFGDYFGNLFRVEIEERYYSGDSDEMLFAGNQPAVLSYPGDEFDVFRPLYGSQLTLSLISQVDFEYISLHTADARRFRVTVKKAGVVFWKGWIIPDLFSEPYVAPPYIVQITARCGLGELENVPVPDSIMSYVDGGTPAAKQFVNLYSIVTHALRSLDLGLNIHEAVNIYNAERPTAPVNIDSTLTDTYVDISQYSELSLYEMLSDILRVHEARMFQQDGAWWIVRLREYNQTMRYRILAVDGSSVIGFDDTKSTTFLIGKPQGNLIVNNGPELKINPAWKEFTIKKKRDKTGGIMLNPDFKKSDFYYTPWLPIGWQKLILDNWEVVDTDIRMLPSLEAPYIYFGNPKGWNRYVKQTVTGFEATEYQGFRLKMEVAAVSIGPGAINLDPTQFAIRIMATGAEGTFYFKVDNYGNGYWDTVDNVVVFDDVVPSSGFSPSWKTYELFVRDVPVTGSIEVRIFSAKNASLALKYFNLELLEIVNPIVTFGDQLVIREFEAEDTTRVIVNVNNSYIPSPVEVYGGDLPDIPNSTKIWKYGYKMVDESRTRIWNNYGGSEQLPILTHMAESYGQIYQLPQWVLRLPIHSQNIKFDSSIVDYQVIGKKYHPVSADFDLAGCICSGTFAEIGAYEGGDWILETGYWNDNGIWIDSEIWLDSPV